MPVNEGEWMQSTEKEGRAREADADVAAGFGENGRKDRECTYITPPPQERD